MELNNVPRMQPVPSINCRSPPINGCSGLTADPRYHFTAASSNGWVGGNGASYGRPEAIGGVSWHDVRGMECRQRYKERECGQIGGRSSCS